ncbi:response regulator [Streptomyces sp. NPDC097107]|uniref:response regulator n=1 Tax=Streptomyces sp. NPDC097107 TaxID=3366089 RepID=UPI00380C8BAA
MAETEIDVVIADDQPLVRAGFGLILGAQPGITVVGEVADGVECIELARRLRPHVVLADIRMPRLDGLEVVRHLAGPGVDDPINVVLITTFDLEDYMRTGLRNGACGFLLKDSSPGLLIETVRAAARGDALVSPAVIVHLLRHMKETGPVAASNGAEAARLSERELDIVRLVAVGRTNLEICDELSLSLSTVKTYLARTQMKLGARNRVEVAAWAWEHGVVRPGG